MNGRDLPQGKVPKQQMLKLIRAASGVEVVWNTDPAPQVGQSEGGEWAWIELSISGIEDIGWDEQRTTLDTSTVPNTQQQTIIGRRHGTLTMMAFCEDPTELEAFDLCERVRMAFNRETIHSIMKPNMSLRWCEKVVPLPKSKINGRAQLRANMDILLNWSVGADVGNAGTENYLLNAGLSGGTLLP